jgi:hypothetical protein
MAFLLIVPADQFGVGKIAMQRRPNWKPVLVPQSPRAESGKVGNDTISHAAPSKDASRRDEDRRAIIHFTIATALALGLPAAIGFGLYFVAHAVLRLS